MAFVPVTNAAYVSLGYAQADGSFAENGVWVQKDSAWDDASLTAVAQALAAWWDDGAGVGLGLKAYTDFATSLVSATARDMTEEAGRVVTYTGGLPVTGTSSGSAIPLGITWALTSRTGLAGRSFRGRWFLVGMDSESFATEGQNQLDAGRATAVVSAMNTMAAQLLAADATFILSVCSRVHNGAPRDAGLTTPITTWGYHNLLSDFQRRRAPGHNRHH